MNVMELARAEKRSTILVIVGMRTDEHSLRSQVNRVRITLFVMTAEKDSIAQISDSAAGRKAKISEAVDNVEEDECEIL